MNAKAHKIVSDAMALPVPVPFIKVVKVVTDVKILKEIFQPIRQIRPDQK